jgi:hypothetical protein
MQADEIGSVAALFRSYPEYSTLASINQIVKELIVKIRSHFKT